MIRFTGMLLRNRENIHSESATKGCVWDINLRQASSKVGVMAMSANKRKKLLSVMCSSSSDEVTAGPHGTAPVGSRLKTLCAFP